MEHKRHFTAFYIEEMDCPDELRLIEAKLRTLDGILDLEPNYIQRTLTVYHDERLPDETIREAIRKSGFEATLRGEERETKWWPQHGRLVSVIASGFFLAAAAVLHFAGAQTPVFGVLLAAMIAGGFNIFRRGIESALNLNFEMNFLMTVAVVGAVSVGEPFEGASVVFLFSLAQLLESWSIDRARDAISSLLDLAPAEAVVLRDGDELTVPVEEVAVGEEFIIKPGEKMPLDGVVVEGRSEADESPVTGESMPVTKQKGDTVFAGSLNQHGSLTVRATRRAEDTTLAKIIHMVEEAQSKRAPTQLFVDKFARIYTPAVLLGALAIAVVPPLLGGDFSQWFFQALVMLVISCPCALVISTPVSIVCALARAARNGVLIKGGAHLEHLGKLDTIIFDKTGTLTIGKPEVEQINTLDDLPPQDILRIAASIESRSEHHLGRAILRKARQEGIEPPVPLQFTALPGRGAQADVDGNTYYIGNLRLFKEMDRDVSEVERAILANEKEGKAIVLLGTRERILGSVVLADVIRENAADALRQLRETGINDFIMLTGDNEGTAAAIAGQLDIDHYHAGLLPQHKVDEVRATLEAGKMTAMVGDGVNDAPALAASTVGIAMGTAGTDAAIETADVALMADDLEKLPYAVDLGRRTLSVIRQNITAALLIKAVFIGLAIANVATLWEAVAADTGASLLVVFNGMRLLAYRTEKKSCKT